MSNNNAAIQDTSSFDRFDIPATVQNVIKVAIEQNVIDAMDAYAMGVAHGNDWKALVQDIVEAAFSWIHTNSEKHSAVVQAAELFWIETNKPTAPAPMPLFDTRYYMKVNGKLEKGFFVAADRKRLQEELNKLTNFFIRRYKGAVLKLVKCELFDNGEEIIIVEARQ